MSSFRPPRDGRGRFVNWSRTVTTMPAGWREPASEDEIVELVRQAARTGRRLRVVGAGHSWSAIAAPHDVAVSLDRFAGVIALDPEGGTVTVRGGTRLGDLNDHLAGLGLALPIVGSIAHQSVAGAIATGTHGSSLTHGNLSSLVRGLRLVTGRGETVDLAVDDARLDGARVHLGALGVVTRVTLPIEPAFRLVETVDNVPVATAARTLAGIAASAEYAKVWWLPHTPLAQVFRYTRTDAPETTRPSPQTQRWFDEVVLQRRVFPAILAVSRRRPNWVPAINRLLARVYLDRPSRVGWSPVMLATPMPVAHRETEAALPLGRATEAFERLVGAVDREDLRVNFPVEIRFVRGDAGWLSPAYGGDTCQIGAYMSEAPGIARYFAAFWREMRAVGARPHWGKELDHAAIEVRALYPLAERFLALRDELDPARLFSNPFLERTLGP